MCSQAVYKWNTFIIRVLKISFTNNSDQDGGVGEHCAFLLLSVNQNYK